VVGDTNFGAKLFSPAKPNRIFNFGGSLDLWLLNGSGMLGVDRANFTLRALAGIDLTKRTDPAKRVPIRIHTQLGYLFDSSGGLVEGVEKNRSAATGLNSRISRIERFGLDVNRVDSLLIGFGAEYVHKVIQPFFEWTFDIPNNRQGYACAAANNGRAPGDSCLALDSGFASTPSRLTIGTRITPGLRGLSGILAFDIGTGATSKFIEEVSPELPWKLFIGIGFAHDITTTAPPVIKTQTIEKVVQLPPPPEYRVVGLVLDERTQQPIANAVIKYQSQNLTGMISRTDGSFETSNLQPGTYSFGITAEGYREGACQVAVSANATATPGGSAPAVGTTPNAGLTSSSTAASASATKPTGPIVTNVACYLKALPAVGTIQGALLDAETNAPIPAARLTIRDAKGRELSLDADGSGAFRFENVPAGAVRISVEANGYMPQTKELEVRPRAEQRPTIALNKRPKKANVVVTAKEVKLTKQVHFANDSATISEDSMSLLQEIALIVKEHPELTRIEIQGHTDDSGAAAYNKRLSQERAEAVRNALVSLGVETSRLTAVGYGQDKPLVPNAGEAAKAKNRRVQMMILERK
jgi:outer membrane protein OmpA-like peptidoglycan-associated protein